MANRNKILEKFSSRFKTGKFHKNDERSGSKRNRPNWDKQRTAKQAQWEDREND